MPGTMNIVTVLLWALVFWAAIVLLLALWLT